MSPGSSTNLVIDVRRLATALDQAMKDHEGPVSTIPKGFFVGAIIPAGFILDKMQKLRFDFSPSIDTHREFVLYQDEKAFEINQAANYSPIEGRTAEGVLENELEVVCRKVKATAKLVIRFAHKTSMWPSEKVFQLHCYSRFDGTDTDKRPGCLSRSSSISDLSSLDGSESSESLGNVPKDEPASS